MPLTNKQPADASTQVHDSRRRPPEHEQLPAEMCDIASSPDLQVIRSLELRGPELSNELLRDLLSINHAADSGDLVQELRRSLNSTISLRRCQAALGP